MKLFSNKPFKINQYGFSHVEIFLAIVFVATVAFVGDRVLTAGHAQTGFVHVSGTSIIDANGNKIFLSGIDGGSKMTVGEGNAPDICGATWSGDAAQAASLKQMGYNTERIAVTWANIEPTAPTVNANGSLTHHWNTQYLAELDTLVQADKNAGIMAILDMHQAEGFSPYFTAQSNCGGNGQPSWLYTGLPNTVGGINTAKCDFFSDKKSSASIVENPQEGMAAVWQMLGGRYSGNTTVIGADMFNEPVCTGANLASFYEKMGNAIRKTNQNIILMYEDNAYSSYMNSGFALKSQPNLTNALYSWHIYSQCWTAATCSQPGQAALEAHYQRASGWTVPLWIGETDAMGADRGSNGSDLTSAEQVQLKPMMDYIKQNKISWTLWGYDNGCCSVVKPGTHAPKPLLLNFLTPYLNVAPVSAPSPTPTVTIGSPSGGAVVSGSSVPVAASATVTSGSIVNVTLKANGVVLKTCTAAQCSSPWDSTSLPNGSYVIQADAVASDGKSSSTGKNVTVNNGPSVTITTPANNASVSGMVPINATGSSGVVKSQVVWDGNVIRNVTTTSVDQYGWGAVWNSANAPNGKHTLTVTVWDAAGASKSASVTVNVQN